MSVRRAGILMLATSLGLLGACASRSTPTAKKHQEEAINFPIEDFTLTERLGKKMGKTDLEGTVWIASFVFTRCTGGCPQITATMKRLQSDLADQSNVRLVTFTVDPERDDTATLRQYAEHFGAQANKWYFLTGDEKGIHELLKRSFKIAVARNEKPKPGDEFTHATYLVVVDKHGNIRGYFKGMPGVEGADALEEDLARLKQLVAELLAEK